MRSIANQFPKSAVAIVTVVAAFAVCSIAAAPAAAIGWDSDDFIVAGFNSSQIGIYDSDLSFKGYLDTNFGSVTGLDFDAAGRVVAAGQNGQVRVYQPSGAVVAPLSFSSVDLVAPIDLKVGPNGNYYVGTQTALREFSPDGTTLRQFATGDFQGVDIVPGGVIVAGTGDGSGQGQRFDLATGLSLGSFAFTGGQTSTGSIFYSAATDTALWSDEDTGRVYERELDGSLVRTFVVGAGAAGNPLGVTRGPGGDVFVTSWDENTIYRWNATGTFLGSVGVGGTLESPINILWTGNAVPEPTSSALCLLGAAAFGLSRRRPSSRIFGRGDN